MKNLEPLTLDQLRNLDCPEREHLIFPWLKSGESAMIHAAPGQGKSFFALTLALMVAGGGEVLGWKTEKPKKVVFWDGEMAIEDLQDRVNMLIPTIRGIDIEAAGKNLVIFSRTHQHYSVPFPDLSEKDEDGKPGAGPKKLFELSKRADLVILDNLSTLATSIDDENAASEFNDIVGLFMKFKQAGLANILIHHSNKSGESFRGSSKLATTFEVILHLKSTSSAVDLGARFDLVWQKCRGKKDRTTVEKLVKLTDDGWESEITHSQLAEQFVELVRTCKFGYQKDIAPVLGVSKSHLSKKVIPFAKLYGMIEDKEIQDCFAIARGEAPTFEEDPDF